MWDRTCGWRSIRFAFGFVLAALSSGCASPQKDAYIGYLGPEPAADEIVELQLGDAAWVRIDNPDIPYSDMLVHRADYARVKLLPGRYRIEWGKVFGFSPYVNPAVLAEYDGGETVLLERGHVYTLRADRTTGPGFIIYFWVEDETMGTVAAGHRKP